jgi:hypothetical protein
MTCLVSLWDCMPEMLWGSLSKDRARVEVEVKAQGTRERDETRGVTLRSVCDQRVF